MKQGRVQGLLVVIFVIVLIWIVGQQKILDLMSDEIEKEEDKVAKIEKKISLAQEETERKYQSLLESKKTLGEMNSSLNKRRSIDSFRKRKRMNRSLSQNIYFGNIKKEISLINTPVSQEIEEKIKSLYQGCYKDQFRGRDLPSFQVDLFLVNPLTCSNICAARKFEYAGLQNGAECWCGAQFGKFGNGSLCNSNCGIGKYSCGGAFENDVYKAERFRLPFYWTELKKFPPQKTRSSSIWCHGTTKEERTCRFQNLYYDPNTKKFQVILNQESIIHIEGFNLQDNEHKELVVLSTVVYNPHFDLQIIKEPILDNEQISFLEGNNFLFTRFLPYNIMHTLHDDLFGLFYSLSEHFPSENSIHPFDFNTRLVMFDDHTAGSFVGTLELFSEVPLLHQHALPRGKLICFEEAAAGLSRRAIWYQYGWDSPQGPIPNKNVNGKDILRVANFILARYGLPQIRNLNDIPFSERKIAIFSRTRNRLILNELDLAEQLEKQFSMPVVFIRLEELTFPEIIEILGKCAITIGMHGSILILNAFLPRDALTIELYPYGVPSENYTPYRHLANLPQMDLYYASWENLNQSRSVHYPERDPQVGGLSAYLPEFQEKILQTVPVPKHKCCTDPFWIFRIYQDTIANEEEIIGIIQNYIEIIWKEKII